MLLSLLAGACSPGYLGGGADGDQLRSAPGTGTPDKLDTSCPQLAQLQGWALFSCATEASGRCPANASATSDCERCCEAPEPEPEPEPEPKPEPEPEPEPEPPPGPAMLTVEGIVGGRYTVWQYYGPATLSGMENAYAYCHSLGNWPAGQVIHCGLDIPLPRGTQLHAPAAATVIEAGGTGAFADSAGGTGEIDIELTDGTRVIFGHMASSAVSVGQQLTVGQVVGGSGGSGGSAQTNQHLHLEVRVLAGSSYQTVDPLAFFGP